ncbi:MAG: bacillithiol biosynthesis deacetylase BshB1 [Paenibacillaceae bacterium]|nr:bacillithiol biosynthesis deacetylase BshB1 [Paenibacillaceae bacterium]
MGYEDGACRALDVLVVGAHPDDAEIGMGATIALLTAQGKRVGICDVTKAALSTNGDVHTRMREAAEAAARLGVHVRENLDLPDRGLDAQNTEHVRALVHVIRAWRPQVVCAPVARDRHPDHVACAQLVAHAVFDAALMRIETGHAPWTVARHYAYFMHELGTPTVLCDVSDVYEKKSHALRAYASQFDASFRGAVATRLNEGFVERIAHRDAWLGASIRCAYAEGFVLHTPLVLQTL